MGSPIALLLADICMNWVIEKASMPRHIFRYVNNLFCIFPDTNQFNQGRNQDFAKGEA